MTRSHQADDPHAPGDPHQPGDQWIREHYPRIHRSAWLMTGDASEAEDLAQEVFLVAVTKWDQFQGRSADSTWLYGILMNLHRRRARTFARLRRRLKDYAMSAALSETTPDPPTVMAKEQWRQSVWSMVASLPLDQQQAITLRFGEEMSYQQIADALGCKLGTAKTRVHHGLKRLRQSDVDPALATLPQSRQRRTARPTTDSFLPLEYTPSP